MFSTIESKIIQPFLLKRYSRLQYMMRKTGVDAMLVTSIANIYYLSGRVLSGYIYVSVDREMPIFLIRRPMGLSADGGVVYINKIEQLPQVLESNGMSMPYSVMLECDNITYSEYDRISKVFSNTKIGNCSPLLREARSVKDSYEVDMIIISALKHIEVYSKVADMFKEGMRDIDLSIEIERAMRQNGSLGLFRINGQSMEIFYGSLLVGDNAAASSPYDFAMGGEGMNSSLPIGANGTEITKGKAVMVDMGGNFTGYMSDITRVFSYGKLPGKAIKAHKVSIEIHDAVRSVAKAGIEAKELYNIALDIATKASLADCFMGKEQQASFVGHGLGIEINELPVLAPRSRDILKAGNIFALEPKFVIDGVGAVGVENTYLVTDDSVKNLTPFTEDIILFN